MINDEEAKALRELKLALEAYDAIHYDNNAGGIFIIGEGVR